MKSTMTTEQLKSKLRENEDEETSAIKLVSKRRAGAIFMGLVLHVHVLLFLTFLKSVFLVFFSYFCKKKEGINLGGWKDGDHLERDGEEEAIHNQNI